MSHFLVIFKQRDQWRSWKVKPGFCHPFFSRFGRIPALKTLVSVARGEELFSHYKVTTRLFFPCSLIYLLSHPNVVRHRLCASMVSRSMATGQPWRLALKVETFAFGYQDTIDEALNQTKKKICMLKINENCVSMNNKRVSKTITDFYLVDKIEIAQNVALEFFQFAIFCQLSVW